MDAVDSIEMKVKLYDAEKLQVFMEACNKIIRSKKLSDVDKVEQLLKIDGITADRVRQITTPDRYGDFGYSKYALTNNSANIRRMKTRVVELTKKENTPSSEIVFDGGVIIYNAEDNRVQINFDEKPGDTVRAALRGDGWRWAPSVELWQRKRTPQAIVSAKRIVGVR